MKEINLNFYENQTDLNNGIDAFTSHFGFSVCKSGILINVHKSEDTFSVSFDGISGDITYTNRHHFFMGFGVILNALQSGNKLSKQYDPKFKTLGAVLDCSRNGALLNQRIKDIIISIAAMGMNVLMLYTEDLYHIEGEPYFGYMRGRYTDEDLKEIDDYAFMFGIEVIPCIQTLAHLEQFLKWDSSSHYKDNDSVLLVGSEETYALIEKMVCSMTSSFRTKRIHIGMDEAFGLGRGNYLDENGYQPSFEIMSKHLSRVLEITRKYNLEPMMWSDMFFTSFSATNDYYDLDSKIPDEIADRIPTDVTLVYWDYYHNDQHSYESMINKHLELGRIPSYAGGVWTWTGFCTNYGRTFSTADAALAACCKTGVEEVFATMWGDDGTENNYFCALLGLQYYAEYNYNNDLNPETLRERTKFCTGMDFDAFIDISSFDEVPSVPKSNPNSVNASKYLLWQDPLLGLFDKHTNDNLTEHYSKLEQKMSLHRASCSPVLADILFFYESLANVLKDKALLGVKTHGLYHQNNITKLEELVKEQLPSLIKRIEILRIAHQKAWFQTYKPFGWEVLDLRYGGLISRLYSTIQRLDDYINNNISIIEELEEKRLPFLNSEDDSCVYINCERYSRIVTPNAI